MSRGLLSAFQLENGVFLVSGGQLYSCRHASWKYPRPGFSEQFSETAL